tara:strand:- start:26 stop:955 length:930 start_codon:yes stop_codon:yes gene_type:complete
MANILLVDPDEIAQKAMKGILARGSHRSFSVESVAEALSFVRRNIKIDLIFVELKIKDEGGLVLVQRLKSDYFLREMPIVVYAGKCNRENVKGVLGYKVQNLLLKPYREDVIFEEITKAKKNAWRKQLFQNETLFCEKSEITPKELRAKRERLLASLEKVSTPFKHWVKGRASQPIFDAIKILEPMARQAGVSKISAFFRDVHAKVMDDNWTDFEKVIEQLDMAFQVVYHELNPKVIPDDFLTHEELNHETEARARADWASAPSEGRCPMVSEELLKKGLDKLSAFPVIDSIAASFMMSANGRKSPISC